MGWKSKIKRLQRETEVAWGYCDLEKTNAVMTNTLRPLANEKSPRLSLPLAGRWGVWGQRAADPSGS